MPARRSQGERQRLQSPCHQSRARKGDSITTIVLGIDGATFDLFGDWLDDLPTFESIIDRGVATRMESCTPPVTSPAWRCYATGKDPGSIGTYWWRQLDRDEQEFIGADRVPLTSRCYWDYLSDGGQSVAVMGVPLNVPPREVNGHLVTGGPYANPDDYTYPESFSETLESNFDYQLHPKTDPASADEPESEVVVADLERMISQRFDVVEWLLEEHSPDLLNLTLFYINHLQHMAWRSDGVKRLWELVDRRLGELLDDETDIVIHSDHGLHEVERVFYLNAWLVEQGYLTVETENVDVGKLAVDRAYDVVDSLGLTPALAAILPDSVIEGVQSYRGDRILDTTGFEARIDFERSQAVGFPHGVIYLLDDDDGLRDRLKADLETVVDPKTGRAVCDEVLPAEDAYANPPDDAPDLLVRYADGFEIKDVHADDETLVFGDQHKFKADNHREGVLLGAGPNISSGELETRPNLIDIAPTVLHLRGEPVPDDMDGRVLTDLFADGTDPSQRDVEAQPGVEYGSAATSHTDSDEMRERLQDLGYME